MEEILDQAGGGGRAHSVVQGILAGRHELGSHPLTLSLAVELAAAGRDLEAPETRGGVGGGNSPLSGWQVRGSAFIVFFFKVQVYSINGGGTQFVTSIGRAGGILKSR